jgi:sialate O-acetylesterase
MIHPLLKYTMRGVIWYQGESTINRKDPELYSRLFPSLIQNWRNRWGQGNFPFYFVQIAPYKYDSINSAFQREAQLKTMQKTVNTGMVVTLDIGEYDNIHPAEKSTVGERLAYWALVKTYGIEGIGYCGPIYREMKTIKHEIFLTFDFAEDGFSTFGKPLSGFTAAGDDKVFYPAQAKIRGVQIVVSSDQVPHPVAVRYCWENFVIGSLYNTSGLPASSFRTDSW